MNWYITLWADAFRADDWFVRLLARLSLLCVHAGFACALILLIVAVSVKR